MAFFISLPQFHAPSTFRWQILFQEF